jgi:hypothetical protein
VSPHKLRAVRAGERVTQQSLLSLARAAVDLRHQAAVLAVEREKWRKIGIQMMAQVGGRIKLAKLLSLSGPYVGRVLNSKKPVSDLFIASLNKLRQEIFVQHAGYPG